MVAPGTGDAARGRRRLAAIPAADVVGYARLVGADEDGTLARLRALFRDVVQPAVSAHGGRVFKLMGDAVLAEFPSAVEAVRCAAALHEAVSAREAGGPPERRIELRIGMHLGDVVAEGGDLLGDGVNIAARLQGVAEPGEIAVSAAVAEAVRGRVPFALKDLGERALKNVERPVRAFRVATAEPSSPEWPGPAPTDRASLAVLPFANLSADPAQDYLADGVTEELTAALARARSFSVVARTSAFAYKGRTADVRRIGRELGARYVLEGSVRRAGPRLRITGQLVETETGWHVWADRFEGAAEDVFALQDALTACVVGAIGPTLLRAEVERAGAKPPSDHSAYELHLRALPLHLRMTREDSTAALDLLRRAMALDPGFAPAKAYALACHVQRVLQGWAAPGEREEGARLARAAFAAHGDDSLMLSASAYALAVLAFDLDGALDAATRAVALYPNYGTAQCAAGWAHVWAGTPEAAVQHFERALCLSPHDVNVGYVLAGLGTAVLMLGRPEEAFGLGEKALRRVPAMAGGHRLVVAALVELERRDEAREAARRFQAFVPNARADPGLRHLYRDQAFVERLIRANREAGLPE